MARYICTVCIIQNFSPFVRLGRLALACQLVVAFYLESLKKLVWLGVVIA